MPGSINQPHFSAVARADKKIWASKNVKAKKCRRHFILPAGRRFVILLLWKIMIIRYAASCKRLTATASNRQRKMVPFLCLPKFTKWWVQTKVSSPVQKIGNIRAMTEQKKATSKRKKLCNKRVQFARENYNRTGKQFLLSFQACPHRCSGRKGLTKYTV